MLSKFKIKSLGEGSFSTRFRHDRTQNCPEPLPLIEVYEAEIRRLRAENEALKIQQNTVIHQLHTALAHLQQAREELHQLKERTTETGLSF